MFYKPFKLFLCAFLVFVLASCATGVKSDFFQEGLASWYGQKFQGRKTASGERFDKNLMTAAHRKLPFGTRVIVHSKSNGKSVVVRINDRGPFKGGRIIDLSYAAAKEIEMIAKGEDEVELRLAN